MRPGPKRKTPTEKAAAGTLRPFRDAGIIEMVVAGNPPVAPDYLTARAIDVWQEAVGRVMSAGATEIDSSLFARYCSLEALVRQAFAAGGDPPPAAYLTVLRQYEELLRIAGPKSRVGGGGGTDGSKPSNPFTRNGHGSR